MQACKKVDSGVDCHALRCKARNDRVGVAFAAPLTRLANDRKRVFFTQDSRSCGGALQALKNLGKVSDLVGRAFHKFFNLVKLPTQDRI